MRLLLRLRVLDVSRPSNSSADIVEFRQENLTNFIFEGFTRISPGIVSAAPAAGPGLFVIVDSCSGDLFMAVRN